MEKRIISVIINDLHIKDSNIEQIDRAIDDVVSFVEENDVTELYILGDVFDSRKYQTQDTLVYTASMLFRFHKLDVHIIPGNHDKNNYIEPLSFLTPFSYFYEKIHIYEDIYTHQLKDKMFHFLPYFEENEWVNKCQSLPRAGCLLTHIGFNGSSNKGIKMSNNITSTLLKHIPLVLSGHYHDYQQVFDNVYHLPSLIQHNFGEDVNKGFTVLYEDLTFDIFRTSFKEYKTIQLDVNNDINTEWIINMVSEHKDKNVRLQLSGNIDNITSLDVQKICQLGIKVENKSIITKYDKKENVIFDKLSIIDEFKEFCKQNKINYTIYCDLLQRVL